MMRSRALHKLASAIALSVAVAHGGPAHAAIVGTCTILVSNPGTLAISPALNVLSSASAGGTSARVSVEPDSLVCSLLNLLDCYSLSASPPGAFLSAPAGGGDTVTYASAYSIDGGGLIDGLTTTRLVNGNYTVDIDLTATRGAGAFPAGNYQAQVTVRCE